MENKHVKKVKVKVIKRKLKVKNFLIFLSIIFFLGMFIFTLLTVKIKNIIIKGNISLSDQEIIEIAALESYPSYWLTTKNKITKRLLNNPFIKEVNINKNLAYKLEIEIVENKALFINNYNQKLVLENGIEVDQTKNKIYPVFINQAPKEIYQKFIEKFKNINYEVLSQISELIYDPNEADDERFKLLMKDQNTVYVTIIKLEELNNYLDLAKQVSENYGIFYLDSGRYFEKKGVK